MTLSVEVPRAADAFAHSIADPRGVPRWPPTVRAALAWDRPPLVSLTAHGVLADQGASMGAIALRARWIHGPIGGFMRHFAEMVLAMMAGMVVLGASVRAILVVNGYPDGLKPFPELSALAMTVEMTLPMAALMLYRGHRRAIVTEMSGAMILPVLAIVGLCLVHVLPSSSAPTLSDVGMYGAMLGVMIFRRGEYTGSHASMGHAMGDSHAMGDDDGHTHAAEPTLSGHVAAGAHSGHAMAGHDRHAGHSHSRTLR